MDKQIRLIYKYLKTFLLLLILCPSFPLFSQNDTLNVKPNNIGGYIDVGILNIFSEPEDEASVYIDDVLVGYTPFQKKIAVGEHKLCIRKENYYDYNEVITMSETKMVKKVRLDLMFGYIKISSTPVGAMVYINDKETSLMTPCMTGKISHGPTEISLKLNEYQTFDTVIDVAENSVSRLHVNLQKSDLYNNIAEDEYYDQLYADTVMLSMLLVSDYLSSQINDSANSLKDRKKKIGKTDLADDERPAAKLKKEKPARAMKEYKLGSSIWIKAGSGLSGLWNINDFNFPDRYDFSCPTFYGGMQYSYRFNRFFSIGIDLVYSRIGYKDSYSIADNQYVDNFKINAIDIPVLAKFYFLKNGFGPVIEIGPILNYKANYIMTRNPGNGKPETIKSSYNALNYGATAGIGCDFRISDVVFTVNVRTIMELMSVFENVNHNMFHVQIGLGVKVY